MSEFAPFGESPLEALNAISDPNALQAADVQAALNHLDPSGTEAIVEAEMVLGFASFGA